MKVSVCLKWSFLFGDTAPTPGDIEIYLNSSPIANKQALEKALYLQSY